MSTRHSIPVAGPSITKREIDYVNDAVANCWYDNANKYHDLLECAFANYIGVKHAVSLPSCTSALHLSLAALNILAGDEVIVPAVTWIASAAPISYVGATPVFCDVDPKTWCIDVAAAEGCITKRTKAIISVDLYGGMPEWRALSALSEKYGIPIIEDAAEAIGSEYHGRKAGFFGVTGVFSFHGSKTLTTGEGGMLVTNSPQLYERVLFLRDHGRNPGDVCFQNTEVAFKYKMSSMQAALGLAQLERIDELVDKKREIFSWYHTRLGDHPDLKLNAEPEGVKNSYWMSSVIVSSKIRCPKLRLVERMREEFGIDTRPFFSPLSSIPAFMDYGLRNQPIPTAMSISAQGINLPSALNLTEDSVEIVCDALLKVVDTMERES